MNEDRTPLQRLDEAVHDFVTAIDGAGTLAGWALVYQTQQISDRDPLTDPLDWDAGYSIAPGMSPFAVVGLVDRMKTVIQDVYRIAHQEDDE